MSLVGIKMNLQSSIVSVYDQTKTTLFGRAIQKTIGALTALAPDRVRWLDVFSDAAITPTGPVEYSLNNRVFIFSAETGGLVNMAMYEYDPVTHVKTYMGKIIFTLVDTPATTHTFRAFKAVDNGTTGWKFFIVSTGSVTANGGLYMINNIARADFSIGAPPTIPLATAGGQKAVYKLENSPFTLTTGKGVIVDETNTRVYVHNGVSATHQYYKFNYSNAITTVVGGITTDLFEFVTGNLPALTGTLLQTNSEKYATPVSGPLSGFTCAFLTTNSNFYLGKLSDLTNGGTTWPSLATVNAMGATGVYVAPIPLNATFSNTIDRIVFTPNAQGNFYIKQFVSNSIDFDFGNLGQLELETDADPFVELGMQAIDSIAIGNGIMAITGNTSGQRGVLICDLRSDFAYDFSYFISPVISVAALALQILSIRKVIRDTANVIVQYRTSGFASAAGGWTTIASNGVGLTFDLTAIPLAAQIQFKFYYSVVGSRRQNPTEVVEAYIIAENAAVPGIETVITQLQAIHTDLAADHVNFQSDHTNFQADHTNFLADHAAFVADDAAFDADHVNFQNDHTAFVADHAAFGTDHTNFLADHAAFVADDAAFDADHVNFQADHAAFVADDAAFDADHAAFVADHSNFQSDHTDFQGDHSNFVADHLAFVDDLNDLASAILSLVSVHSSFVSDHAAFVADHANFVTDHSNFVADHAAFVVDDANFDADHVNFQADHAAFQSDITDLDSVLADLLALAAILVSAVVPSQISSEISSTVEVSGVVNTEEEIS